MYICSILVVFGHYWSFSVVQTPFLRVLTFDPQANDLLTRWVKVGHQSTRTWTTWMRIPLSGIMTMTYYDCEYHSYIYIIIYIILYILTILKCKVCLYTDKIYLLCNYICIQYSVCVSQFTFHNIDHKIHMLTSLGRYAHPPKHVFASSSRERQAELHRPIRFF